MHRHTHTQILEHNEQENELKADERVKCLQTDLYQNQRRQKPHSFPRLELILHCLTLAKITHAQMPIARCTLRLNCILLT